MSLFISIVRDPSLTSAKKNCPWLVSKYCAELSTTMPKKVVCHSSSICHTHHPVFQIILWTSEDKNIWDYCHFFPRPHAFFRFLLLISPSLFICCMVLIATKSHWNNGWLHLVSKDHSTLSNYSQLDQYACNDIASPLPSSAVEGWKYMSSFLRGCQSWNFWVAWSFGPRSPRSIIE